MDARAKSIVEMTGHAPVYASLQAYGSSGPATLLTEWASEVEARAYVATGAVGTCKIGHDSDLGWYVSEKIAAV